MVPELSLPITSSSQQDPSEIEQQCEDERSDVPAHSEIRNRIQQVTAATLEAFKIPAAKVFCIPRLIEEIVNTLCSQEPSQKTPDPFAVIAVAAQLTATGVVVRAGGSPLTFTAELMRHANLVGCQVALIASTGAIFLQDKKPKVARFMVNIGTVAVVLSAIGMGSTSLTKNAIWLGTIPCAAILAIFTVAAARN